MARNLFHGRLALATLLLLATLPVVAPWCDAWCLAAHGGDAPAGADATAASSEHDHCLQMAAGSDSDTSEEQAPTSRLAARAHASCDEVPVALPSAGFDRASVQTAALVPATPVPGAPEAATTVTRRRAGPAPPLIPTSRPLALRL